MERPRADRHYPRSVGEFQAWFRTEADCLDYLEWLRWPAGFACPGCGGRTSVTAGTIFGRTRTPLTVWPAACWLFATGKHGISALSLKRTLEIGSYQTAWAMLHRLSSTHVQKPAPLGGGDTSPARASSPTAGRAITDSTSRGASTTGAASEATRLRGEDPPNCSQRPPGWPPWSSAATRHAPSLILTWDPVS